MDILVGLDDVDWDKLHHAYGKATDVPDLLRALASDDEDRRWQAGNILNTNIIHQWTIYEASIETIPFLVQLLDVPSVKHSIPLDLLNFISFGGMERPDLKERTQRKLQEVLPIFIKHLYHSKMDLRLNAIEHFTLYPHEGAKLIPLLQELIEKDEGFQIRLACLKSLVFMWTEDGKTNEKKLSDTEILYITKLMRDLSQPLPVQFEAAHTLLKNEPETWMEETSKLFYEMMNVQRSTLKERWKLSRQTMVFQIFQSLLKYPETNLKWVISQASHPQREVREHIPYILGKLLLQGLPLESVLPTLRLLMRDISQVVRKAAIMFFIASPYVEDVRDILEDIAKNDTQSSIRDLAMNALASNG